MVLVGTLSARRGSIVRQFHHDGRSTSAARCASTGGSRISSPAWIARADRRDAAAHRLRPRAPEHRRPPLSTLRSSGEPQRLLESQHSCMLLASNTDATLISQQPTLVIASAQVLRGGANGNNLWIIVGFGPVDALGPPSRLRNAAARGGLRLGQHSLGLTATVRPGSSLRSKAPSVNWACCFVECGCTGARPIISSARALGMTRSSSTASTSPPCWASELGN